MTTPPGANVDTTGVVGNVGAIPVGTQYAQPGTTDTSIGTGAAGGSVTAMPNPPGLSGTPDTEGVYGPNKPELFSPVSTLLSGSLDTTLGYAGNMTQRTYRAPLATPGGTTYDTTGAKGFDGPVPPPEYAWMDGTTETANFGAPGGKIVSTSIDRTIDQTTPTAVSTAGVIGAAASLAVVNKGRIITVVDESHAAGDPLAAFVLTNVGVLSTVTSVIVKKGATVLVKDTDYTVTVVASGSTRNLSILGLDSATVNPADTFLVTYTYGNPAYFTPVALVLTTDYLVTFTGGSAQRTFTLLRAGASSAVANGDTVGITYQVGDSAYWGTHDPIAAPPAPIIGTAVAGDRKAKVVWTLPALSATDDIDGYLIQTDTGGTRYVPGGNLNFWFETLVPGQAYKFRVAAFNEKGIGEFSALSNAVVPLNYDEVPTGSLDPKNTGNPIYNADGTIVAGTGLDIP